MGLERQPGAKSANNAACWRPRLKAVEKSDIDDDWLEPVRARIDIQRWTTDLRNAMASYPYRTDSGLSGMTWNGFIQVGRGAAWATVLVIIAITQSAGLRYRACS